MMKIRNILLLAVLFLSSCDSKEADILEKQQTSIVKFLTSTHTPKLIAEGDVEESLEFQPEFYTTSGKSVYRYIADYYNTDREDRREVAAGDRLMITFWCYDFANFAKPSPTYLLYTNDPLYEDAYIEAGLNPEYWDFEPMEIALGSGDILKSIDTALVGCKEGDMVEFYLTSGMGYGDKWIGLANLDTPTAFFCKIESIEN